MVLPAIFSLSLLLLSATGCARGATGSERSDPGAQSAHAVSKPAADPSSARSTPQGVADAGVVRRESSLPPSAAETAAGVPPQIYAEFLNSEKGDLDAPIDKQEPRFTVQARPGAPMQKVNSCREVLALPLNENIQLEEHQEAEYLAFWSVAGECVAREWVQKVQPAHTSLVSALLSAPDPAALLPPELHLKAYSYEGAIAEASARCRPWKSLDPHLRLQRKSPSSWSVRAEEWDGTLELFARGDFDGDGFEDLIVQREGEARGGTLMRIRTYVLTRTAKDHCIRVLRAIGQE